MKGKAFNFLIIVLTVHIFAVQTKILYFLSPELAQKGSFSVMDMNEHAWLAMIFALSYSMATAFIIYLTNKWWIRLVYAIMDGLAVGI